MPLCFVFVFLLFRFCSQEFLDNMHKKISEMSISQSSLDSHRDPCSANAADNGNFCDITTSSKVAATNASSCVAPPVCSKRPSPESFHGNTFSSKLKTAMKSPLRRRKTPQMMSLKKESPNDDIALTNLSWRLVMTVATSNSQHHIS